MGEILLFVLASIALYTYQFGTRHTTAPRVVLIHFVSNICKTDFLLQFFSLFENQLRFRTFSTNHTLSISYYCVKFRARRQVTEVGFAAQSTKGNSPISANLYNAVCGQTWQGGTVVGWQLRAQPVSYRMITVFLRLQYPYFLPRITDMTTT